MRYTSWDIYMTHVSHSQVFLSRDHHVMSHVANHNKSENGAKAKRGKKAGTRHFSFQQHNRKPTGMKRSSIYLAGIINKNAILKRYDQIMKNANPGLGWTGLMASPYTL